MKKFYVLILSIVLFNFTSILTYSQGVPAREESRLDQVYENNKLTGEGVVIAIIDRGIDYFHTDFIDDEGNTRLLYLYDMINQEGANDPDNPYGVGTIFNEDEINSSLVTDGPPLSMDRYGHGTATSGIAGGDGSGTESLEFQGVAPSARFIIIKATQDYFPPFDDQPGQDPFFDASYIPIALQFIADKVGGMPTVALINLGSVGGPTDGTSSIARAMDDFVDLGHTLVCGVGDDGGNDNHASATLNLNESIELEIQKGETGFLRLDLWYDEEDRFEITITRPDNTIEGPFPAPATANDADDRFLTGINYYHRGANQDFFGATSNRRELLIDFTAETGLFKISVKATQIGGSGSFHATLNPSRNHNANKFLNNVVEGYSLNDYTSAKKNISPGDYVVKNDWVDMDGIPRQFTGQGDPGELWTGSSWGPTQDNRLGIDFAACGEVLYGAYSMNTWYSHFPHLLIQGGENMYGIQNAVSAAAPLTTGVIALMLEMDPALSPAKIKSILQETSRNDSFTGSVPNNKWGYGKLDAMAAIEKIESLGLFENNQRANYFTIFPNPSNQFIKLSFSDDEQDFHHLIITNINGQQILSKKIFPGKEQLIDIEDLPKGIYQISLMGDNIVATEKFIKL